MAWTPKELLVLIGATIIVSPLSFLSYYGNFLPYLASYYYARRDEISMHIDPLWPSSVFRGTFTMAMLFTSPFELRFGLRPCMLFGTGLLWVSVMGSYFAVQQPLALILIFGGTHGMAVGIIYPTTLKLLLLSVPHKAGLATGILACGPVLGALVNIGVAFAVINPHNRKPDLFVDNKYYFSDHDIVDRMPNYFLVIGAIMVGSTSVGIILAFIGSSKLKAEKNGSNDIAEENYSSYRQIDQQIVNGNKSDNDDFMTTLATSDKAAADATSTHETDKLHGKVHTYSSMLSLENRKEIHKAENQSSYKNETKNNGTKMVVQVEMSPREAVKTGKFWMLWLCYICASHTAYLQTNLYKQYGQLAISDDSMLVTVGILGMAANVISRPAVGVWGDKFGIRKTGIVVCLLASLFMACMVVCVSRCPWLFGVFVVLEFLSISPQTMVFSLLATFEFGTAHCASNIGLVSSGNFIVLIMEPFLASCMVQTVGWDWLFLTGSISAAASMIGIMVIEIIYCKKAT